LEDGEEITAVWTAWQISAANSHADYSVPDYAMGHSVGRRGGCAAVLEVSIPHPAMGYGGALRRNFGMLSNFAVVVANHGLMPVVDIGYVPSGQHWKPATRSDHLIFLCDRIHLFGPTWPIMESVGKSLADWSITAPLGDFLMAGSMVSIGDLLITVALLLWLTEWLAKRRAAWRLWERQ
jgi:hypothetical protein